MRFIDKANRRALRRQIYYDRREWTHSSMRPYNHFCRECRYSWKTPIGRCPACGSYWFVVSQIARIPRRTASKAQWRQFWNTLEVQP